MAHHYLCGGWSRVGTGALDKATGITKKYVPLNHSSRLFSVSDVCDVAQKWLGIVSIRVLCAFHVLTGNGRIIGCAVAQHCYNGDVRFLCEKLELWPPEKNLNPWTDCHKICHSWLCPRGERSFQV